MESKLPEEFLKRLSLIVPKRKFSEIKQSFYFPKKPTFRVNLLKSNTAEVLEELKELNPKKIPQLDGVFFVEEDQKEFLSRSKTFLEGKIYIQNISSILAVEILDPKPNETILDLAAAPGGKTLLIAQKMKNQGKISAVEPKKDRFFRLKRNIETFGGEIIKTYNKDGRAIGKICPLMFDKVLLDAPCSSEAKFHIKNPKSFAYWSKRKIKESQRLQKRLILSAWNSLKAGGVLLYSTCSFAPEENEEVVNFLLQKDPKAKLEKITLEFENTQRGLKSWEKKSFDESLENSLRILPNEIFDGFFIAKILKEK
jgi:16S rRNA (cytosine1407-C5)-methyltransferase